MHTRKETRRALPLLFGALLLALFAGCFSDPATVKGGGSAGRSALGGASNESGAGGDVEDSAGAPMGDGGAPAPSGKCLPALGEKYPQRSSILSLKVEPAQREVQVAEIFSLFSSQCKGCHIEANLGGFQVTKSDFTQTLRNPEILKRLESDDPVLGMPSPFVMPYSQRPEGDSIRTLVRLLKEWAGAGYRPDLFYEDLPTADRQSPYELSTDLGLAFTNIGTCVPSADFPFGSDRATMTAMDKAFAERVAVPDATKLEDRIGLPLDLAETDLVSFDSAVLARKGVVAFAPAYPLWSDDAGKLRYVRVPLGKSIRFDSKTQRFEIPDNTRFYKTFMKQVKDLNGEQRWRKVETRVIVARHDTVSPKDIEHYRPQALFGSYRWDETETHATLVTKTLRDGDPFADDLFEYVYDEPVASEIRAKNPANLTYELHYRNVSRHWAIPGSDRCIHCHEGSLDDNFILGFSPVQINRRKLGDGGVYEPATKDELGQLQRLIDLGVITGVESPAAVVKLEDSQLGSTPPRKPRNDHELKAQAYILANCAHCHNQQGFPSVANPVLADVLNLYPGKRASESNVGGVFQFPLERVSPRIHRNSVDPGIAYITPSLRELVTDDTALNKTIELSPDSPEGQQFLNVPWRSLIYRNVQTPFPYDDTGVLYPHMPFDSAGHDCRAAPWLGEWMVSIPAVRKHPELPENCVQKECQDLEPQPYVEVLPGQDGYDAAAAAAAKRLQIFQTDPESKLCPDNSDIVDPDVYDGPYLAPRDTTGDGVPDRPNWVVSDTTERKGLWVPRRGDWKTWLVDHDFPPATPTTQVALDEEKQVIGLLASMHRSDVSALAGTKFPLALWQAKAGCKFDSSVPKVGSFQAGQRPTWFDNANPDPDARVFEVHPGQAIFDMICINCHGPNADSKGRLADSIQTFTGGNARVANFRFGLFNPDSFDDPYDKPDQGLQTNRERVFGPFVDADTKSDDWGARYLTWMALGGTSVSIPQILLQQVDRTPVAGQGRGQFLIDGLASPNMLQAAQGACAAVLGSERTTISFDLGRRQVAADGDPLIHVNGDQELWRRVCSLGNAPMVRALRPTGDTSAVLINTYPANICDDQQLPAHCFPSNAPVGNERGDIVAGLQAGNLFPWCILDAYPPATSAHAQELAVSYAVNGKPLPICPADWTSVLPTTGDDDAVVEAVRKKWIAQGAINAGFLVFDYLDKFIKGESGHVQYDQCELLPVP